MTMPYKLKIGFFVSGGGTNMQAVFDACNSGELAMEPVAVVSNISTAKAIDRAHKQGIPAYHISKSTHYYADERDDAIIEVLQENKVDIVILAGYLQKISPTVLEAYKGRIINIHPGPLPEFGGEGMHGEHVHQAVLDAKVKKSGPTVHLVDEEYDRGPTLKYTEVDVLDGDTVDTLKARVLEQEYLTMVSTLKEIVSGEIVLPELNLHLQKHNLN